MVSEAGAFLVDESLNDWRGQGYDDSVPGEVTKTSPNQTT